MLGLNIAIDGEIGMNDFLETYMPAGHKQTNKREGKKKVLYIYIYTHTRPSFS